MTVNLFHVRLPSKQNFLSCTNNDFLLNTDKEMQKQISVDKTMTLHYTCVLHGNKF